MKLQLILIFILLFNCSQKTDVTILNTGSELKYKASNEIDKPILKILEDEYSKDFLIEYEHKNDSTTLILNPKAERIYNGFFPSIYKTEQLISNLKCNKKISIISNELTFNFCYSDILVYLDKQVKKSNTDPYYSHFRKVRNSLLKIKSERINTSTEFNDYIISELIMSIPFSIEDNYGKTKIGKVTSGKFYTGFSGGYEHFIYDIKNDTIASFSYTKWVN
tara:strand:+ start:13 stop:675 length:663 start_codon:yes stop_codon:yes gene_type:complete